MRGLLGGALFAGMITATAAFAGDGNQAYVLQESPEGTPSGNTLVIFQDEADNSLVHGIGQNLLSLLPEQDVGSIELNDLVHTAVDGFDPFTATQQGEGNSAKLELTGSRGELQLLQSSAASAVWVAGGATAENVAEIVASGNSLGGIIQIGERNEAHLGLDSSGGLVSQGLITQLGNELKATLNVAPGGTGVVTQIGNNSSAGSVNVAANTSLTYTQIGDNLVQSTEVQAYSTNPANIIITQTAW